IQPNCLNLFPQVLCNIVSILGYDGYTTCTKPFRGGKSRLDVPCDFNTQNWCTVPGSYYPWRAVRRFVYENHGLMRRMYGAERHISVLRSEIESNDVEYQSEKWSQESNLKHYKLKKEEFKTTHKTTTQAPVTNRTSAPDITTSTGPESTTESDFTTTDFDFETTTEFLTTTMKTETESKPQIFQDTLEKSSTTTEKAQLFYRTKGVNACPVKEEVVAPFWANNTRGEILALLNLYPFEQYVHWERCTFENKQMFCREGCRCEQQYRLHRLLAYDPSNDCRGIFSDWFKFPSCCVCRCYDLPSEFRLTSRSPRKDNSNQN
ncbi:unnamed protein product, partial [Nezara viridula]